MPNINTEPRTLVFTASTFALPVIDLLLTENNLAGVILPDPSELATMAAEIHGLAAQFQHASIPYQMCCREKLPLIIRQLDTWQAELGVIATYPHILPIEVINYFASNLFNLHASRLPEYKGPAPMYWQIRNREKDITLALHRAEREPDSGNIVAQKELPIHPLDTLQSLSNQLAYLAREVVSELFNCIREHGKSPESVPQGGPIAEVPAFPGRVYARRPTAEDGVIDFYSMSASEISAICRAGANQGFAATVIVRGAPVALLQATPVDYPIYGTKPGTVIFIGDPEGLIIGLKNDTIRLDVLANVDGVFNGIAFAERFSIDAGLQLQTSALALKSNIDQRQ